MRTCWKGKWSEGASFPVRVVLVCSTLMKWQVLAYKTISLSLYLSLSLFLTRWSGSHHLSVQGSNPGRCHRWVAAARWSCWWSSGAQVECQHHVRWENRSSTWLDLQQSLLSEAHSAWGTRTICTKRILTELIVQSLYTSQQTKGADQTRVPNPWYSHEQSSPPPDQRNTTTLPPPGEYHDRPRQAGIPRPPPSPPTLCPAPSGRGVVAFPWRWGASARGKTTTSAPCFLGPLRLCCILGCLVGLPLAVSAHIAPLGWCFGSSKALLLEWFFGSFKASHCTLV